MLKTGASLVVAAGTGSAEMGEKEYYSNIDAPQIASRRSSTVNGRKRKRRPQLANAGEASDADTDSRQYWRGHVDDDVASIAGNTKADSNVHTKAQRRRKQPAIREPLAALEKEQKLYELRDRQRQEHGDIAMPKGRDKSYRRPYAQAKKENESPTTPSTVANAAGSKNANELKHLLKNSGGLSLSEILQQKNLSLDDLLKGKENALLALQTTAASPIGSSSATTAQKTENFKHLKPARRIPATYLSNENSDHDANSSEYGSSDETSSSKNKFKFPTLQRLKLFGTSSRATAIPLPGSGDVAMKKREPNTSTTSSTTSTTRLPLYKKRAQQRPTLKPPALFKFTTGATMQEATVTKEATSSKEMATSSTKAMEELEQIEPKVTMGETYDDLDTSLDEHEAEMEEELTENVDTTTENVLIMTTVLAETTTTAPSTSTTTIATKTPSTPATAATNSSSSRRNKIAAHTRQRTKLKFRERINDNNIKTNSIEMNDAEPKRAANVSSSRDSVETRNNSGDEDGLENFFEEVSKEAKREAEEMELKAETITARIDRTQNYKSAHSPPPLLPSSTEEPLPDFDGIDDRTDLLELIEDRRSGNRLFKVLQQRNMTLDELIEHRKRGSSQLHLATIVEQNARSQFFPGQKVVLHDNMDIVTAFENFPHFNLLNLKSVRPDDIKTDSQGSSYFTSIIDIEPTDEVYKGVGIASIGAGDDGSLRGVFTDNRLERQRRLFRGSAKYRSKSLRN